MRILKRTHEAADVSGYGVSVRTDKNERNYSGKLSTARPARAI